MPRHTYTASGKVAQQLHPPVQTKGSRQQVAGPVGENRDLDAPTRWDISAERRPELPGSAPDGERSVLVAGPRCLPQRHTVAGVPVGHVPGGKGTRASECGLGTASSMVQWSPNPGCTAASGAPDRGQTGSWWQGQRDGPPGGLLLCPARLKASPLTRLCPDPSRPLEQGPEAGRVAAKTCRPPEDKCQ